jgi:putative transcriptional regulator
LRNWLKQLRIQKGLTQLELAQKAEIERSYYTMIENGDRNPSVNVAKKIGTVIDIEWTIFFDTESNETKHSDIASTS